MLTRTVLLHGPVFFIPFAAAACSSTPSADLATSDIRATMAVTVHDNDIPTNGAAPDAGGTDPTHGSNISAELNKGDSALAMVDLSGGDSLHAATNLNPNTPMKRLVAGLYGTDNLDLSGLTSATFVLTRKSKTSAPSSEVSVPIAIALTAPKQDDTVSLSGGKVTFTWSNPVQGAKVYVTAHVCGTLNVSASNQTVATPDTGSFDVAVADLGGAPTSATCYLASVVRIMDGTADPAWHSGSAVSAQRSFYLTFTGTP